MERLYGVEDLCARWHCKERTARDRMREIGSIGRPKLCRECDVEEWEIRQAEAARARSATPEGKGRKGRKGKTVPFPIQQGPLKPGQRISRVRLKA